MLLSNISNISGLRLFKAVIFSAAVLSVPHIANGADGADGVSPQSAKIYKHSEITYNAVQGKPGIYAATLFGDPSKAGPYVQRLKFDAGLTVAPHYHNDTLKVVSLVEGVLYFAYGDEFDEGALKPLTQGDIWTEAKGQAHFAMTKDSHAIIEIHGVGPISSIAITQ